MHGIQLQRLLSRAGVQSRQQLLDVEVQAPVQAPQAQEPLKVSEEGLREQLRELDELLEDELIEEEAQDLRL